MRCAARAKTGRACQAPRVNGSEFCYWHAPELASERAKARSRGGRARHGRGLGNVRHGSPPPKVESVGDVLQLLNRAVVDAYQLENSYQRARVVASLSTVMLKAIESTELAERIEAIEERIKHVQSQR